MVSCYDYISAKLVAAAGVEALLAGDSAAQFVLGLDNTTGVSLDFMLAITSGVRRAAPDLLLTADMPYEGCRYGHSETLKNAKRFIDQCGADIVKIEMVEADLDTIKLLVDSNIPVMPHLGIRPQTGIYKAQGTTADVAADLIAKAQQLYKIGVQMLLLEGTAREVAKIVSHKLPIPVISCGSGPDCDGQVLVLPDILNLKDGPKPKFAKSFADVGNAITKAVSIYDCEIKQGIFPGDEHCYHIKPGELEKILKMI